MVKNPNVCLYVEEALAILEATKFTFSLRMLQVSVESDAIMVVEDILSGNVWKLEISSIVEELGWLLSFFPSVKESWFDRSTNSVANCKVAKACTWNICMSH